jgi:hypothetical protein
MLILMGSLSIPVVLVDLLVLKVHRRPSTGLDWTQSRPADFRRVATKLLGLLVTLAPIAFAYWVFPEYQGSFYEPLYDTLRRFWLSLVVIAVTYVWFVDGLMVQPRDAYWQLGRLFSGHPEDARKGVIANHYLGWLVKAYFFPLMFVWLHGSVHTIINFDLSGAEWSNLRIYDFLYSSIFGVDLLFTTAGYALSMKVIDTHIRTAEPTPLGWRSSATSRSSAASSTNSTSTTTGRASAAYSTSGLRCAGYGRPRSSRSSPFTRSPRSLSAFDFRTSRTGAS